MSSRVTSAIRAPTFDAVDTAPRTVVDNFYEVIRRMTLQKLGIVGQLGKIVRFDVMQRIGKRHFAKAMMMTVALSVRGDIHDLWPLACLGKSASEPLRKAFAVIEQPLKRYALRNRPVIEKNADALARRQLHQIRPAGIDFFSGYIVPVARAPLAHAFCLPRRKKGELDPVGGQNLQSFHIDRGFWQPHAFRRAPEAILEIPNAPLDLRSFVARVGQRQNHVDRKSTRL